MIDEKRLDEIERSCVGLPDLIEAIRLARLGLWANQYGVPAMKDAESELDSFYSKSELNSGIYSVSKEDVDMWYGRDRLHEALAALPKEER